MMADEHGPDEGEGDAEEKQEQEETADAPEEEQAEVGEGTQEKESDVVACLRKSLLRLSTKPWLTPSFDAATASSAGE
jgi:hypothetical protein